MKLVILFLNVKRKLPILIPLVFLIGCANQNWEVKKAKTPKLEPIITKPTEKNDTLVQALAQRFENSIYEGETDTFESIFYLERFNQIATYTEYQSNTLKKYQKGFTEGFSKGIASLPEKIIAVVDNGGYYDFLEYYYDTEAQTYRMLFRLFSEEDGINYHDFHLIKSDGAFYVQDIYIYLTGENLSETANKIYLMSMPKNLFEKIISGDDSENMKHMMEGVKNQKIGNNSLAIDHLNRVKGEISHSKIYHVIKILAASDEDETIYMEAMLDMQKDFAKDPTCQLLSIDYYFLNGELDKALGAIDDLEEKTGDSFLNYQRANLLFNSDRTEEAIPYYEQMIVDFPSFDTPKFSLIDCYSNLKKYKKCVALLDEIIDDGYYTVTDLIEFVESTEEDGTNPLLLLAESEIYKDWKTNQL